jgi:predicted nucleotidyltransferase
MPVNRDLGLLPEVFEKYPDIQAVYLFGSSAEGTVREDSDLDLAIFPGSESLRKKKLDILTDLAQLGFCNADLVILGEDDIVLLYEVVRHNRIIYQTDAFDRCVVYSRVIRLYLDLLPYLEVQRKAYKKRILHGQTRGSSETT